MRDHQGRTIGIVLAVLVMGMLLNATMDRAVAYRRQEGPNVGLDLPRTAYTTNPTAYEAGAVYDITGDDDVLTHDLIVVNDDASGTLFVDVNNPADASDVTTADFHLEAGETLNLDIAVRRVGLKSDTGDGAMQARIFASY